MCGIFGWLPYKHYYDYDLKLILGSVLKTIEHRGPDDYGYVVYDAGNAHISKKNYIDLPSHFNAMIGQVRLSIIDLSPTGHQPMFTDDGRYSIVYNGEVYNYIELRKELEVEGVQFNTPNDTEVVLKAFIHWGKDALQRFQGMFAFVIYDKEAGKLFCARDFFGIKPFYYYAGPMGFCFASDLPSLLEFPDVPRKPDPTSAYNYLVYGISNVGGETMLKAIYQIPPAHYMEIDVSRPYDTHPIRYWKPDLSVQSNLSFDEAAKKLRSLFLESVRMHLRSDVPLGVALSGGIDSSAVTCAIRYLMPEVELHTFSFIATGTPISEEKWAAIVAEHTKAIRHIIEIKPDELINDIDALIQVQGEPFGSTSIYAGYKLVELVKHCGITVTLDGQGADELLAGYMGYPGQRLASLIKSKQFLKAYKFMRAVLRLPGRQLQDILMLAGQEILPGNLIPLARKIIGKNPLPKWLNVEAIKSAGGCTIGRGKKWAQILYPSKNMVLSTLASSITWDGLPTLLRYGDRNAMARSIESRVPFLTKDIAEFCLSLPEEYLIDMNGRTKSVFREAMRGIVPDEILDRKDKIGFATPEKQWLLAISEFVDDMLSRTNGVPFLNMETIRNEWDNIKKNKVKYDWRVWRWINYIRWIQIFDIHQ